MTRTRLLFIFFALLVAAWLVFEWAARILLPPVPSPESPEEREERRRASARTRPSDAARATAAAAKKWRETLTESGDLLSEDPAAAAEQRNAAASLSLRQTAEAILRRLAAGRGDVVESGP